MIEQEDMDTLLVQSCTKSENRPNAAGLALDSFTGYLFRIIKLLVKNRRMDLHIDPYILSAEHELSDTDGEDVCKSVMRDEAGVEFKITEAVGAC